MAYPAVNLKLIGLGLIILAILGVAGYIWYLRGSIEGLEKELQTQKAQLAICNENLTRVTEDIDEATLRISEAEKERQRIQRNLTSEITRLRNQKPPRDCQEAINWAIENKGDLSWSK